MPPVLPAIGGAFAAAGAALAASPILTAAVQLGAGLVLSAAARRLAPRPESSAARVSIRAPVVPRDIVYGRVRKGGTLIFVHRTRNNGSDFLHLIYALAGHRIAAVEEVYFDGRRAIDTDGVGVEDRYQDSLIYQVRLGTEDQAAIAHPTLPTDVWGPEHRCRGVPLVYLRLRGEEDDYPNGLPNVTFLVRGRDEIFDPRTGTFGYTANAALCVADYMAWRRFGLGLGYGVEGGIDTAALVAAANVCDELVLTGRPPLFFERRYTCNGVLSSSATPKENIEAMLTAMGGSVVYAGGRWRLRAAAYQVPTVALTPADIRPEGIVVTTKRSRAENFNAVRGQFVSPENDWQPDDFPAFRSAVYLAEDQGVESWSDLALPFTTTDTTAQRLAKIALERVRRQQVVQVAGQLSAWRAQVGDTVTLTYPLWGWSAKPFEVRKVTLAIRDGMLVPDLTLAEVSPLQYDWSATEEQIYAAAPATALPDPFVIDPPGAPQIDEEVFEARDGTVQTRLRFSWPPSAGPFLSGYEVQTRQVRRANGTETGAPWQTLVRTSLTTAEREPVGPGRWGARVQAISTFGRRSAWSSAERDVLGLNAPPAALQNVTLQAAGGLAILKWALSPDPDVRIGGRIVIRHSVLGTPTWANSVSYDEVAGNQTIAVVPQKPGAYLLRAVDASGIAGPVTVVSTKGIQAVAFVPAASLVEHPTFAGARANLTLNGANQLTLTNTALPGLYSFSATMDRLTVRSARLRSLIEMTAVNPALTFDAMPGTFDAAPGTFDNPDGGSADVVVEAKFTDDNPAGSPVWTDWTRLDSNEVAFRAAQFRAQLTVQTPGFNVLLTQLAVFADEVT